MTMQWRLVRKRYVMHGSALHRCVVPCRKLQGAKKPKCLESKGEVATELFLVILAPFRRKSRPPFDQGSWKLGHRMAAATPSHAPAPELLWSWSRVGGEPEGGCWCFTEAAAVRAMVLSSPSPLPAPPPKSGEQFPGDGSVQRLLWGNSTSAFCWEFMASQCYFGSECRRKGRKMWKTKKGQFGLDKVGVVKCHCGLRNRVFQGASHWISPKPKPLWWSSPALFPLVPNFCHAELNAP